MQQVMDDKNNTLQDNATGEVRQEGANHNPPLLRAEYLAAPTFVVIASPNVKSSKV